MEIQTFHKYNRLARRGLAEPLRCSCGVDYTLRATEDGDPLLQCFVCDSITQPGLKLYERIKAVNSEFY